MRPGPRFDLAAAVMSDKYLVEEIVVIAISVLCLVLFLAALIICNIGFERSARPRRTNLDGRQAARNKRRGTVPTAAAYRDETFLNSVRRQSAALAEDLRREPMSLKHKVSLSGLLPQRRPADPGVAGSTDSFVMDSTSTAPAGFLHGTHGLDSAALTTGRDAGLVERRRSNRMASDEGTCDLEGTRGGQPVAIKADPERPCHPRMQRSSSVKVTASGVLYTIGFAAELRRRPLLQACGAIYYIPHFASSCPWI